MRAAFWQFTCIVRRGTGKKETIEIWMGILLEGWKPTNPGLAGGRRLLVRLGDMDELDPRVA